MSKEKKAAVVAKRAGASEATTARRGRFSAPRKVQAVLRLLGGEDLELLSRELGVIAGTLFLWREQFLTAGQADPREEQIGRLKKKVGELTMDNKLLREKSDRLLLVGSAVRISNRGDHLCIVLS